MIDRDAEVIPRDLEDGKAEVRVRRQLGSERALKTSCPGISIV